MHITPKMKNIPYHTALLEVTLCNKIKFTGTGFFVLIDNIKYIFTSKHVVEEASGISCSIPITKEVGSDYNEVELNADVNKWIPHPNPKIDLCCYAVTEKKILDSGIIPIHISDIASEAEVKNMPTINEVLIVGYPNGLWDKCNSRPIIRRGITATHPALRYNWEDEFVIDAACHSGSSGSPVFSVPETYEDPEECHSGDREIFLIGVLSEAGIYSHDKNYSFTPVPCGGFGPNDIPLNLGKVIHAKSLVEFQRYLH